jgi:hypothetical protein
MEQRSLETLVRRCLGSYITHERIQAGHVDVLRVMIKLINGKSKAPQKAEVVPARWTEEGKEKEERESSFVPSCYFKSQRQAIRRIWTVSVGQARDKCEEGTEQSSLKASYKGFTIEKGSETAKILLGKVTRHLNPNKFFLIF